MRQGTVWVLLGLAVGALAGGAFVGRARAQQQPWPPQVAVPAQPTGPHYQYTCLTQLDQRIYRPEVIARLNQMGQEGWRLMENRDVKIGASGGWAYADVYCFERKY